jgi:hypothetical protein
MSLEQLAGWLDRSTLIQQVKSTLQCRRAHLTPVLRLPLGDEYEVDGVWKIGELKQGARQVWFFLLLREARSDLNRTSQPPHASGSSVALAQYCTNLLTFYCTQNEPVLLQARDHRCHNIL